MDDRYRVFAAVEPGTEIEDFMDNMCGTDYVRDSDYAYGEDYGIPDSLFYILYTKNRYDAGMIARSIYMTSRLGIRKGGLYRVSVGAPGSDLDEFIIHCKG